MFSPRTPAHMEPNALALALQRQRAAGRPLIDLTLTNPTAAGIASPDGMFAALTKPEIANYDPHPFGLPQARAAVAADYARRGVEVDPAGIVLTSSTSEAYSLLFKLLCAPCGESVLTPAPSYPLFEHLTRLDGVRAVPYPLEYDGRWRVDFRALDEQWEAATRAVLAVTPNNPTGSVLTVPELSGLSARCAAREAALIVDEVFADYPLDGEPAGEPPPDAFASRVESLTFRLGGLSKSAGLPQVKLGWVAVEGPEILVAQALQRLELICDTYLSVSTPAQVAAPDLIACGAERRRQIAARVRGNYAALRDLAAAHPAVRVLHAEAGWSAVLRVPARGSEEEIALVLLERDGVVVHPGFFFDFPHEAFLVVSLLPEPPGFDEGIRRVLERLDE